MDSRQIAPEKTSDDYVRELYRLFPYMPWELSKEQVKAIKDVFKTQWKELSHVAHQIHKAIKKEEEEKKLYRVCFCTTIQASNVCEAEKKAKEYVKPGIVYSYSVTE